jgi:hypothetical protein
MWEEASASALNTASFWSYGAVKGRVADLMNHMFPGGLPESHQGSVT